MSLVSTRAQEFVRALAGLTGLNTRVLQGWVAQEEGNRKAPLGHEGDNNWLNVGFTNDGPVSGTHLAGWKTPQGAAKLTADWMNRTGQMSKAWGPAAPKIQQILSTARQSPAAQIKAIQGSGWATGGETSLAELYGQAQGLHGVASGGMLPSSLQPVSHAASTKTTTSTQNVTPDTSLMAAIQALAQNPSGSQQQAPTSSFDPGYNKFSQAPAQGYAMQSPAAAPQSDLTGQLAGLSQLVGPSAFTTSKTTTVPASSSPSGSGSTPAQTVPKAKGLGTFKGTKVAAWIVPILDYAQSKGWGGTVNSGFRTLADQTRIYNSGVRPAAKPGTSNHEFTAFPGGAVDVSDAAQLSQILQNSQYAHVLKWAGSKDPVHFSHPHNGSY